MPSMKTPMRTTTILLMLSCLMAGTIVAPVCAEPAADWTLAVWMMGDNDLEESAVDDLVELASARFGPNVNVVAMVDRAEEYSDAPVPGLKNWTSARYLKLQGVSWAVERELGEIDSGERSHLVEFAAWAFKKYPAKRTAFVFWDHGGGWVGFGSDDSHPESEGLSIADISTGLAESLAAAGAPRLDLLGFDACLMGNLETVRAMRTVTRYVLASSELEPGHGWDHAVWSILNTSLDPVVAGKAIMQGFGAQAVEQDTADEITLSLVDTDRLEPLESALFELGRVVQAEEIRRSQIGRLKRATLGFGKSPNPDDDYNLVDLSDLVTRLQGVDDSLIPVAKAVKDALVLAVVDQITGKQTRLAGGLPVYFPNQKKLLYPSYSDIDAGAWKYVLDVYFEGTADLGKIPAASGTTLSATPPALPPALSPDVVAPSSFVFLESEEDQVLYYDEDEDLYTFEARLAAGQGDHVYEALFSFGYYSDESIMYIGDAPAVLDGDLVSGDWDATVLRIRQGRKESWAYLSEDWNDDGSSEYTVPLYYYPRGKVKEEPLDVVLNLSLDAEGVIQSEQFWLISGDTWSEFTPRKGSFLSPALANLADDEDELFWFPLDDTRFDPFKPLEYEFDRLVNSDDELFLVQLTVWDRDESEATASALFEE